MAKKYIGLEEAAEFVGVLPEELIRRREKGDIRGFADRGTWKFKTDDLQELRRRLQTDSNPDVPILADSEIDESAGGSSVLAGEDDAVGEQSTTIRNDVGDVDDIGAGASDSDVRLILDESLGDDDSDPEVMLPAASDSDSDVQLFDDSSTTLDGGAAPAAADSDSDVQLAAETPAEAGSDSDVALVGDADTVEPSSDSDVKLVGDSDQAVTAGDSELTVSPGGSSVVLEDEEGSSVLSEDSGISLSAESGISLESLDDSGISLAADDSGLSILDADSGLTLEAGDSGISLEADSGISLEADSGSSLDQAGTEELDQTAPMAGSPSLSDDDGNDTELEIPVQEDDDDDSEFELQLDDTELDSAASSSVLLFEDEEDPDEHLATVVKPAGGEGLLDDAEGETFDISEGDSDAFDLEEDEFGTDEDEFDVADDILGEDDELDELDVFDADDDVFDESLETGESHAEFVAPRAGGRVEADEEAEWSGLTFTGLLVSTALMAVCTMLMFDLVRSMWAWNEPSTFNSGLLDALSQLFEV